MDTDIYFFLKYAWKHIIALIGGESYKGRDSPARTLQGVREDLESRREGLLNPKSIVKLLGLLFGVVIYNYS